MRTGEVIFEVVEEPDGGLIATALGHGIVTQADDVVALRSAVREAVACHFEEADRPLMIRLHFVRDEVMVA